jgi:hypothetical protein
MGSDERMLARSGTEQGGQGMSVRKQTGGEMPGTAGRKPALVCGSWGGLPKP